MGSQNSAKKAGFLQPASKSRMVFIAFITCLAGTALYMLDSFLYRHDFASNTLLYLGEKALLVHDGVPPRLENMGLSPPLPLSIILLLENPFVAAALTGGFAAIMTLLSLYRKYRQHRIGFAMLAMLFCYVLLSPVSLFLLCQQPDTCILLAFMLLMYHHYYMYGRHDNTYNLFMFGMLTAFLVLTRWQAILLVPLFSLVLAARMFRDYPAKAMAVSLTSLFPSAVLAISLGYLTWVFLGDPFYFLSHWSNAAGIKSVLPEYMLNADSVINGLNLALLMCVNNVFLILPYVFMGLWLLVSWRKIDRWLVLVIYLSPLFLLCIQFTTSFPETNLNFLLIFVATAVFIYIYCRKYLLARPFPELFVITILLSFTASFYLPMSSSQGSEEREFCQILTGQKLEGMLAPYRSAFALMDPRGKILTDDAVNFPIVYMARDPKRFILPYQYEFEMVLAAPQNFARYLLVSDRREKDRLAGRYPMATVGYVPHFIPIGHFENLYLYESEQQNRQDQHAKADCLSVIP